MESATAPDNPTLVRETTLRMSHAAAEALADHMRQDDRTEQMAFGLASQTVTDEGTLLLLDEILIPDRADLVEQSVVGVCPTRSCQGVLYLLARQSKKIIVEFHTHPGPNRPHFSTTDQQYGARNAEYIRQHFPEPTTLALVVGNNRFDRFDGVVFDRGLQKFLPIHRWESLGRPNGICLLGQASAAPADSSADVFDRQQRIPGWNQEGLELQRIGILGAGGNGAALVQLLAAIGAGRRGFIAIADHDTIEPSNLPRIPYALAEHLKTPKVAVAAQYVRAKSPGTPVFAFPSRFNDAAVLRRLKMATVLFHCGDNDGGRKEANDLAIRYGIPLIDLGCDIQVSKDNVVAGGQVRLVLPGDTACLVCCGGYDPAQAALDQMDEIARAVHASQGYVIGAADEATPSVANLNGLTAQFALSQLLALVNGPDFAQWDYLHFDQFTGRTIPARTTRDPECPQCGNGAYLMAGDPAEQAKVLQPKIRRWGKRKDKETPAEETAASPPSRRKWWNRSKKT